MPTSLARERFDRAKVSKRRDIRGRTDRREPQVLLTVSSVRGSLEPELFRCKTCRLSNHQRRRQPSVHSFSLLRVVPCRVLTQVQSLASRKRRIGRWRNRCHPCPRQISRNLFQGHHRLLRIFHRHRPIRPFSHQQCGCHSMSCADSPWRQADAQDVVTPSKANRTVGNRP
jgi:hypothetical protein